MQKSSILTNLLDSIRNSWYDLLKIGAPIAIPGLTGSTYTQQKHNAKTQSKSKTVMRKQRGNQPQYHKARRTERALARTQKRTASFCNNLDTNGNVIKN